MIKPETDMKRMLEQMTAQVEKTKAVAREVAELQVEGEVAEGHIKVTVTATGSLVGVHLDPKAMRMPSEDLAEAIVEASRVATQNAAVRVREIWAENGVQSDLDVASLIQGSADVETDIDKRVDEAKEAMRRHGI
ncbi:MULTISPECIES: YbaB/EbfC family nucleoid-associated protein [unclassified Nocardioides]|uniref:YbaB/EbfC family nucleoid-associated protein n=1 Tax=unclassified Nocardioides TaxID=2615069 RepID=UPI0006F624DA|nr:MULTISPECIES: YbaB/EbfC family nucleoid-associated protein [unclassified Nocardioides]KQY56664.1 hypothetical protein ASD30_10125 [Nocardioides sp. Root140]KQZ75424.1 hypothetical protein ASD66_03440 [Nocardioides sp. Root151]KRF14499.1 hypothetical protein ASH02_09230 [Nocardioides sp. Soil796]